MKNITSLLMLALVVLAVGCSKNGKADYLAKTTVTVDQQTHADTQDTVTALTSPYKINDSDVMFVKIERRRSGDVIYMTAVTTDDSIRIGQQLIIRIVHLRNNSDAAIVEAHKAPTPIGH